MNDYNLSKNNDRDYSIHISDSDFAIQGMYALYSGMDTKFISAEESVSITEFLGIGVTRQRPYKQILKFCVLVSAVLFLPRVFRYIDHRVFAFITLALIILFVIQGIKLLFSKKEWIEISFVSRHFFVPKKSMTEQEFRELSAAINERR